MASLRWGLATHEGNVRPQNEDNAFADGRLFVVADGMGGHLAGEVASEMVVTRLHERFATIGSSDGPAEDTTGDRKKRRTKKSPATESRDVGLAGRDALVAAVYEANGEIYDESASNPDRSGMGTTVTVIAVVDDVLDDEVFAVANVGDSRIYRLRHERLRQISVDHSFVQELVAEGAITRDEARTHPRRNIITRALGIDSHVRVDSWTLPIVRGDRYVLCSDGLVDEVTDDDITSILIEHADPQDAAERCVALALVNGGRDNVTVLVVDVLEGHEPPAPTEELEVIASWDDDVDEVPTGEVPITVGPAHASVLSATEELPSVDVDPTVSTPRPVPKKKKKKRPVTAAGATPGSADDEAPTSARPKANASKTGTSKSGETKSGNPTTGTAKSGTAKSGATKSDSSPSKSEQQTTRSRPAVTSGDSSGRGGRGPATDDGASPASTSETEAPPRDQSAARSALSDGKQAASGNAVSSTGEVTPRSVPRTRSRLAEPPAPLAKPSRRGSVSSCIRTIGLAAVLIFGGVILTAWARSGYFVALNEDGVVTIYKGKNFLWFHPTAAATLPKSSANLDADSLAKLATRPAFGSRSGANEWAADQLQTTTTTTTTTTTSTTVPPTPATSAPPAAPAPPDPAATPNPTIPTIGP